MVVLDRHSILTPQLLQPVRAALQRLDEAGSRSCHHRQSLDEGLAEYYARILPLTQHLERLRYHTAHNLPMPVQTTPVRQSKTAADPLAQAIKTLYRELVKSSHPDAVGAQGNRPISRVIAAYNEGSISALWLLRIEWRGGEQASLSAYVTRELRAIEGLHERVTEADRALRASPAWALKDRLTVSRERADAITGEVEARLAAQIAALETALGAQTKKAAA